MKLEILNVPDSHGRKLRIIDFAGHADPALAGRVFVDLEDFSAVQTELNLLLRRNADLFTAARSLRGALRQV